MEFFSEIYSIYCRAVELMLKKAAEQSLSGGELQSILTESSFSESAYFILHKLTGGNWPLLKEEIKRYSVVCIQPEARLTSLQKSWLRALLCDPCFSLFFDDAEITAFDSGLSDAEPLYMSDDFHVFDGASDNNDYRSEIYREHFSSFLCYPEQNAAVCQV